MIGKTISHYKIIEKLGEGGMGVVYKAEDTKLKRTVALKFLPPELTRDAKVKRRFVHEAQAASAMDHSNICTIYEVDETEDGQMFICMAYYQGKTLKEEIDEGALEIEKAIDIAIQVGQGLAKAHAQGIVHRDIKPANIFITDDREVKIVDFGLAKLAGQVRLTSTGKTMGTVAYMSPEQGRGDDVGPRTDIWALGVILYEMVTGRLPYEGDYEMAVMYSIMHEEPEPMANLRTGVPEVMEQIVNKAMAKKPEDRYLDVSEMLSDLYRLKREIETEEYTTSRAWKFGGRSRKALPTITVVVAVIAVLAIVMWLSRKEGGRSPILQGQPLQVTSGDAWEGEPALSPDGGRIAYASDISGNRDIYVIDIRGGNPLRLTTDPASDHYPAWFPDGSAIAFVSDRGGKKAVWKIGQLGGGATLLLENASYPAVSPDGDRMAFSRAMPRGGERIGVVPIADPANVTMLTGDEGGFWDHRSPAWSPDGKTICYSTHHNLWVVPSTGGRPQRLTSDGTLDSSPAWSRDGQYVYFSSFREGTLALWRADVKEGISERLTMGTGYEIEPSVCLDGSRLAYATRTVHRNWVIRDLDSGEETRLPGIRDDFMAAMAPDRSKVVSVSDRGGSEADLWVQPLELGAPSGPPRRLTDYAGDESHPIFSPDGNWLAYYLILGEQRDIWTISISGGQPIQFTEHPAMDYHPAWSPDGSMLAFVSERDGGSDIWIAPVKDGRRTAPPKRIDDGGTSVLWPTWSPNGAYIAFVGLKGNQYEAFVVPVDGSEPARQITTGGGVRRIRWNLSTGMIFVSGTWGEDRFTLRRVSPKGGEPSAIDPPIVFGSKEATVSFDVSLDGRLLIFSREDLKGNIWVLEAKDGIY